MLNKPPNKMVMELKKEKETRKRRITLKLKNNPLKKKSDNLICFNSFDPPYLFGKLILFYYAFKLRVIYIYISYIYIHIYMSCSNMVYNI